MARKPEIGNVQIHPNGPLRSAHKNGFVLKFYCPIRGKRIRKNCGTRDRREARRIQRECRERLLNGEYVASGGGITAVEGDLLLLRPAKSLSPAASGELTWDQAYEHYRQHRYRRLRRRSSQDSDSRIEIAGRIFETRRQQAGLAPGASLRECTTLEALEFLQDRLLDGAEGRYKARSPNTVNSMLAAVMTFLRYCRDHEWIDRLPPLKKIDVDEVMRGRPITTEEFERMLAAVPKVVGEGSAPSWSFALRVLWESGFRMADLLDFSWDDERRIHPVWPSRKSEHPTIVIPATQKNGKNEEIPMPPGLRELLREIPEQLHSGFVVNPVAVEYTLRSQGVWFRPDRDDLQALISTYSNCAIGRACGVSEQAVRTWLKQSSLERSATSSRPGSDIPDAVVQELRERAVRHKHQLSSRGRLTAERIGRIISRIGEQAGVIVKQANGTTGRVKYASAHDLRRSLAARMINAGVSAETLMVLMRHRDFATTRKFYGATRSAQSAAAEIAKMLAPRDGKTELMGGLVGGNEEAPRLSTEELLKLKALLNEL